MKKTARNQHRLDSLAYDLEKEEFIRLTQQSQLHVFPLRRLFDTTRLLDFRTAVLTHPQGRQLHDRFDALVGTLTNYKIPVVTLKDLTVEEVCPIFERINSSGTKLSTYDLMVAATWTKTFDLNDQTEEIQEALRPKGFDDIDGNTVLKCLSAIHHRGIKKEQVFELRKITTGGMDALVDSTRKALLKAVDLLTTEFLVYSWDFLPYEAIVIILNYIFAKTPSLNQDQVIRVRQWFWRSAFSERYRGASEAYISSDLEKIHNFVVNQQGNADQFGTLPPPGEWKTTGFQKNYSRSRAFALALAMLRPRNLTNGQAIVISEALSAYNQKEFHHVYPRAHLKKRGVKGEHNAVANICMLAASENKVISDTDPNAYLPLCISQLGHHAEVVFASNLLPNPSSFDYGSADYQQFLDVRATCLHKLIETLCEGKVV